MESNNNKKIVKLDERVKQVGGTLIIKEAKVRLRLLFACQKNINIFKHS